MGREKRKAFSFTHFLRQAHHALKTHKNRFFFRRENMVSEWCGFLYRRAIGMKDFGERLARVTMSTNRLSLPYVAS